MITVGLNTRLFVIGNPYDPHLYVYSDKDDQITIGLYTMNGQLIDTMQVSISAGETKDILLGDWLDQKIGSEGFYIILVGDVPLVILAVEAAMSNSTPDDPYLRKILVYDKATGLVTELPPNTPDIPASNRYIVARYYHDEEQGKGKLVINEGFATQTLGWARFVIFKQAFTFPSKEAMFRWMLRHAWAMDKTKTGALGKIASIDIDRALNIVSLYGVSLGLGDMLGYKVDTQNLRVEVTIFTPLGWGWDTVKRALTYAAAGAVAGAAIGAAVFVSVASAGVGTVAGLAIAGAGIGFAIGLIKEADDIDDSEFQDELDNQKQQGEQQVTDAHNKAMNDLEWLLQNGEITQEAYNILKADIDELYQAALKAIEDLYETAKSGYKEGYKAGYKAGYEKAKSEMTKWLLGSGIGGFILGAALAK